MRSLLSSLSVLLATPVLVGGSCDCGSAGKQPQQVIPAPQQDMAEPPAVADEPKDRPPEEPTTAELPEGKDPATAVASDDKGDQGARQPKTAEPPSSASTTGSARGASRTSDKPVAAGAKEAASPKPSGSADPPGSAPAKAEAEAPAKPSGRTSIPSTKHVRAEVPKGLRALLDADSRMQPWINKVMGVADKCYAQERGRNPFAKGIIAVKVTMHPNARPSAAIKSLPPLLAGVVACATGELTSTKMPLFTGPEGQNHTVKIHFSR